MQQGWSVDEVNFERAVGWSEAQLVGALRRSQSENGWVYLTFAPSVAGARSGRPLEGVL
jgi:hypothetical protein